MKRLLHVGCGRKTIKQLPGFFAEGWKESRLDIDPDVSPDIVASLTDMSAVESGSFDAIWSSHNIEHVFHHQALDVCKGFRRILRPKGFAVITCPDIQFALEQGARKGIDAPLYHSAMGPITARDMLFGHQDSIAKGNAYMAHLNGFDLSSLRDVLVKAGFRKVFGRRIERNLWFIAGGFADTEAAQAQYHAVLGAEQ